MYWELNNIGTKKERDLLNGVADEFAAEDNMIEQDGEVAVSFRVLGLLIKNVTGNRH